MKTWAFPLAAGALIASPAFAQSSVTMFGVADASLRYLSGATSDNKSSFALTDGAISQSRWGMYGKEDLGQGMKAIFMLEGGYHLNNGTSQRSGKIFNRKAYVGLDGDYGKLTLGTQDNPAWELLIEGWDPLTVGNYDQNEWMPVVFGTNGPNGGNNAVKYTKRYQDVQVGLEYIVGGVAGSTARNSGYVLSVAYVGKPFGVMANVLQNRDINANTQMIYNLGVKYEWGPVTATLGYYNSNDKTGFVDGFLSGRGVTGGANPRKDNAFYGGVAYQVSKPLTITAAVYYDRASNVNGVSGDAGDGSRETYVLLAEYGFSRRTTLYGTVDYSVGHGAQRAEFPNNRDQTGVGIGLRHRF
ncbi:porin [Pandoraea sp. NPDC090278]|uniref:porin n=1 Tax=Pandoraea sp. NPDC090278 TaxID=3364391 RepID=UPI00383A3446